MRVQDDPRVVAVDKASVIRFSEEMWWGGGSARPRGPMYRLSSSPQVANPSQGEWYELQSDMSVDPRDTLAAVRGRKSQR